MEPQRSKTNLAQSQRDYKMDFDMAEEPPPTLESESQGTGPAQSAEDVTTTTTGSFSSNELWWSILPYSRARRLWLVLRSGLYRLVEKMKRAELRVMHLTHGLESLRRLEIPAGLLSVARDAESMRLVLLDRAGQLHLHAEDGWARGHAEVPVELTGLVALVGFQHMGQNPGRFIGWGPEGLVILCKDLQVMSRNFLDPCRLPTCCGLLPGKAMVIFGEEGGGLSLWEFRGGGRRLVLSATLPTLSRRGQTFSRLAVDVAPRGVFPRCFAVCGTDLLTYDLATRKIVDVRRKLHKTLISDLLYCEVADVVVTASRDSTVKVWEPDWQIRSVFVGHTGPVTALTQLPNSMLVLSASQDMTLRTWNLETAQQMGEVSLRSPWDGIPGKEEMISYPSPSNCFETVCRLWPPVRPGAPLLAQGATYLELWIVRQLHQPLATLSSKVQGLELAPPLPQADRLLLPQRVVSRCSDCTVRVFSCVSGLMISTLLLEPGELAAATAYCLPREVLLVLSSEGALLRANATRCPMPVVRRLPPPPPAEPQPCCLHLINHIVDQRRAYNYWESVHIRGGELRGKSWQATKWEDNNRFLPVLGYTDGSIAVLDWGSLQKFSHIMAHSPGSTTNIASCPQSLVTAGTDKTVKMWHIFPYGEDCLTLLRTFFCYQSTVTVCPLGCRVTVALEDPCSATYSLVQDGTADCEEAQEARHDHGPQEDHTDHITGLCCCPYLKLYASSSLDCTLRIWTEDNKLLRIMHLNTPPEAITFCNDKGDLILAIGSQLSLLSHKLYLPTIYLVKVLCRKLPHPKEDPPLVMSDLELLSPEKLRRLKGWQALPRVRMKQSIKQEYIEAEKKELEIQEACAKLALRDQELEDLALGQVEPLAQILITPQLRLEAFHNYLQVIYGSRLDSVSKEEDEALQDFSGSMDRRPLTSMVSQSSICQKWGVSLDVMFMQGATSTKSSRVEKIPKLSQIPLSQKTLQPCTEVSGFFPSSRTLPGLPSTITKKLPLRDVTESHLGDPPQTLHPQVPQEENTPRTLFSVTMGTDSLVPPLRPLASSTWGADFAANFIRDWDTGRREGEEPRVLVRRIFPGFVSCCYCRSQALCSWRQCSGWAWGGQTSHGHRFAIDTLKRSIEISWVTTCFYK